MVTKSVIKTCKLWKGKQSTTFSCVHSQNLWKTNRFMWDLRWDADFSSHIHCKNLPQASPFVSQLLHYVLNSNLGTSCMLWLIAQQLSVRICFASKDNGCALLTCLSHRSYHRHRPGLSHAHPVSPNTEKNKLLRKCFVGLYLLGDKIFNERRK